MKLLDAAKHKGVIALKKAFFFSASFFHYIQGVLD